MYTVTDFQNSAATVITTIDMPVKEGTAIVKRMLAVTCLSIGSNFASGIADIKLLLLVIIRGLAIDGGLESKNLGRKVIAEACRIKEEFSSSIEDSDSKNHRGITVQNKVVAVKKH
jgi:hypothetical protein